MNKTKTFSMFLLAGILFAGTISMTIPKSFAQGFNDNLGSDDFAVSFPNNHKKQGSDVNIQKVKCNNIIINGVEKSHQMPGDMTGNTMTAADEANDGVGQLQSQGFANGEKKFKGISGNIVNVCINKNNIVAEEPVDTCESCIEKNLDATQISNINTVLEEDGITFQVGEEDPQPVNSLDEVCEIINNAGGQVTSNNIKSFFQAVNAALEEAQQEPIPGDVIRQLTLCLQDAGLVSGGGRSTR